MQIRTNLSSIVFRRLLGTVALWMIGSIATERAFAEPTVLWANDPVGPGQTVLVEGNELDGTGPIRIKRVVDDALSISGESAPLTEVRPLQITATSLKFVIPSEMREGAYEFSFANARTKYRLNLPSIYWLQGDQGDAASPGGWLRVFGRNIGRNENVRLALTRKGETTPITLPSSTFNLWNATFVVPTGLPAGSYVLRLWNGNGDANSWKDAGVLEVHEKSSFPALTLNAKEFGVIADGRTDNAAAFKSALQSLADRGGGTLFLPRGYYKLSDGITIPPHTRLKGEDRSLVRLIWPDTSTPPFALIEGESDFAVEDVTIVAFNHGHIISGGFRSGSDAALANAQNIAVRRVVVRASMYRGHLKTDETSLRMAASRRFRAGSPDTVRLSGKNLEVSDSDLYGSGRSLFLLNPRSGFVVRNKLRNGRWGWYSLTGPDKVIFENNEISGSDLQGTGGGINTLGVNFAQNVAFIGNKFETFFGWDREAVTSDGPGGCYFGRISALTSDGLGLVLAGPTSERPTDLKDCVGAGAFILGGRGIGQVRLVESVDGNTLKLDRPYVVAPDSSSVLTVTSYQRNYLIIRNEFSDASVAVQFYGSAVDHVVADNVIQRAGGLRAWGLQYRQYQPNWYIQFLSNRILEGDLTTEAMIGIWGMQKAPNVHPLAMGVIVRGNQLARNAHIEVKGASRTAPGVRDVIIEENQIRQAQTGILVDQGAEGILIRDNLLEDLMTNISDESRHESP